MARAYGANTQLVGKFESSYGTPPSGNYNQLPFVSSDLGSEQGLIASDLLGQGRDPAAPIRDVIRVEGNVVVPVDLRNFGLWLKALLGLPTTEEDGDNYTHTFVSGLAVLPSLSLEVGMPDIPAYFLSSGIRANSLQLNFSRSGAANATINCIAQGETRASSSGGGTPTALSLTRFNQFQGSVKKDGSVLGNVTGAQLTYSNNLERIETIRSDGKIEGADPTIAALTGNIDVRFADTALIDAATNNTPIELEFAYDANTAKTNVAQGYTKTQNFTATTLTDAATVSWDASNNQVCTVTLAGNRTLGNPSNKVAGATYVLIVKQDATGSRTLAYNSVYKFPNGVTPVLSTAANAVDILTFVTDGTNMYGVCQKAFS